MIKKILFWVGTVIIATIISSTWITFLHLLSTDNILSEPIFLKSVVLLLLLAAGITIGWTVANLIYKLHEKWNI